MRNLRIGILLAVCYLLGMIAAYHTTELLRGWRVGTVRVGPVSPIAQLEEK